MPTIKKPEYIDRNQFFGDVMQKHHAQSFTARQWSIIRCDEKPDRIPLGYTATLLMEGQLQKLDGSTEDCRLVLAIPDEALYEIAFELIRESGQQEKASLSLLRQILTK